MGSLEEMVGSPITRGRDLLPLIEKLEASQDHEVSNKGARGRFQIMPGTARDYGFDPNKLHDPSYGQEAAGVILDNLWKRFNGDPQAVLVAYNAGPTVARRWLASGKQGRLYAETQGYLNRAAPFLKINGQTPGNIVVGAPSLYDPKLDAPDLPDMEIAYPGKQRIAALSRAGFSDQQIADWRTDTTRALVEGGFTPQQIDDYWGDNQPPNVKPMADLVKANLEALPPEQRAKVASNPLEYAKAGWNMSIPALMDNGGKPSITMPDNAGFGAKLAFSAGQMAGDLPVMGIGAMLGATAAAPLDVATAGGASVVAGGYASFALPAAMREIITGYQKRGEVHNFQDVLSMAGKSLVHINNEGMIGSVAALLGGKASETAASAALDAYGPAAAKAIGSVTDVTTQALAMTTAGAALEGKVPSFGDFAAGAVLGLGAHVAMTAARGGMTEAGKFVTDNLIEAYRDSGVPPWKLSREFENDPVLLQQSMAQDPYGNAITSRARQYSEGEPAGYLPPPAVEVFPNEQNLVSGLIIDKSWMLTGPNQKKRSVRLLPSGQVVPDPTAVASYLRKFGDLAGFSFMVGPADKEGPGNYPHHVAGSGPSMHRIPLGTDKGKYGRMMIYMPDSSLELNRRWYGLSTSEILFHEVGHALDGRLFGEQGWALSGERFSDHMGGKGNIVSDAINQELLMASKEFAPQLWKMNPQYRGGANQVHERMADAIAAWLSNPTIRARMPNFEKAYGKLLEPFVEIVNKTLPRKIGPDQWERPEWDRYEQDPEMAGKGGDDGSGELPPPPPPPEGPEFIPPDEPPRPPRPPQYDERTIPELYEDARKFVGERTEKPFTVKGFLQDMYRRYVSDLIDPRQVDKMLIEQGANANTQMLFTDMVRQQRAFEGRLVHYVRFGGLTFGRDGSFVKDGSPSIEHAIELAGKHGGNGQDWITYMVASRAIDKFAQGFETGHPLSIQDLHRLVEAGRPLYEEATNSLQRTLDSGLDYGRDSGIFTQESVDAMRQLNPTYVTFSRIIDEFKPSPLRQSRRTFFSKEKIHNFEGGEAQIDDPLLATIDNLGLIIKLSDQNRTKGAIVALAEAKGIPPEFGGLKRIPIPEDWMEMADKAGDPYYRPYNTKNMPTGESTSTPFLAERALRKRGNSRQFIYYRNGVPELWQAENEHLAMILRGAESAPEVGQFGALFEAAAKFQRDMIVLTPDFGVRNVTRDQVSAFVLDPNHPVPFVHFLKNAMEVIGAGEKYQDWVANGGMGSSLQEMGLDSLKLTTGEKLENTGTFDAMWNTVRDPMKAWSLVQTLISSGYRKARRASNTLDEISRVGFADDLKGRGFTSIKAATASRAAFLDFVEKGTSAMLARIARTIPFAKPAVLSVDQFARGIAKDPAGVMLTGFVALTLPTIAINMMNYYQDEFGDLPEDRKFRNVSRYQKDGMIILPEINGVRVRIPVGQTISPIFVGLTTRFMDHFLAKDPEAFRKWGSMVLAQVMPPFIPSLITPFVEHWANTSTWTGHALIPAFLEKNSGPMQYTEATTEPAKALSRVLAPVGLDVSPIVLENYARDLTGTLGMSMLRALNIPMKTEGPPWSVADIPFVGSFIVRNGGMGAQPIQDFFDKWEDIQKTQNDVRLALLRQSRGGGSNEETQTAIDNVKLEKLSGVADGIRVLQAVVQGINNSTTMTNAEKLRNTDIAYSNMVVQARFGLSLIEGKQISNTPISDLRKAAGF